MKTFLCRFPWFRRYWIARAERVRAEALARFAQAKGRRDTRGQYETHRAAVRMTAQALIAEIGR